MKKLLLIAVLATMATTAMAENLTSGTKAESKVEVRAEIVSGGLKITDIYGKPLILDLGQANQGEATNLSNTIEYKVTAKDAAVASPIELTMDLAAKLDIYNSSADLTNGGTENDKLNVVLTLDNKSKSIATQQKEVVGTISGATKTTQESTPGKYSNTTLLTATVQ